MTIARTLWRPLLAVEVDGTGNVPTHGPLIVAANHGRRRLDPLVLGLASPRRPTFVSAIDLRRRMSQRLAGVLVDILYVEASTATLARFRQQCESAFRRDAMLVIFPEGAAMGGGAGLFRLGTAYLAQRAAVPVTPTWIEQCGRRRFQVRFGPTIHPPRAVLNRRTLTRLTDEIQGAILSLAGQSEPLEHASRWRS
jgi:1-acyl-sn-glycerol-3-phosphate acyltransferase